MDRITGLSTVIDLFAGVGGLSLGAARAGFSVATAVELDPIAIETHRLNFPESRHIEIDISKLSGPDLLSQAGLERGQLAGLIGGPPCQGFSSIGKRHADDPRNKLFSHFFRLVSETRPLFFLAENVPGILAERNADAVEAAMSFLPNDYTVLPPFKVKASDFGAATTRTRVFFIGYRSDDMVLDLPETLLAPAIQPGPTVGHALTGLPSIRANWNSEEQSWRKIGELPSDPFFQRIMGLIPQGVGNPYVLERYAKKREVSGCFGTLHTPETIKRLKTLSPGKTDPVSHAPRLKLNGYCPTLRAGTAADRGSYQAVRPIHPTSPRVITPREAARLQGFPDWFVFHPTKWHSFRQIGNSVSPIVAEAILTRIKASISN